MLAMIIVNGGNYFYNLLLGRFLGPIAFADAALLITLLLVLSFVGMTFQIVVTKYVVLLENPLKQKFLYQSALLSIGVGVIIGFVIFFFNDFLCQLLKTNNPNIFKYFAIGIPFYFFMSINRGVYQGKQELHYLGITYLSEMLARLLVTFLVLYFFVELESSVAVILGILISFIVGLIPVNLKIFNAKNLTLENLPKKEILTFFTLTAFYELTLIIINNSDILLVKTFFNTEEAGLYASLALIGRVVYFVTWMFVMILLPKVIQLAKEGKNTTPILMKNLLFIGFFSFSIVIFTFLFPDFVVQMMFGERYLSIAPLLWKYALATALFALANVFAYYFLSLNKYFPVFIAAIFGILQVVEIIIHHQTLNQVVMVQVYVMFTLLIIQIFYYLTQKNK